MCFFSKFLQFETKFHVNALFVIHDLRHILKRTFSQPWLTTDWLNRTCWNLSHIVTKVRRAASRVEDPCFSFGSHSAEAFTVLFDHSGIMLHSIITRRDLILIQLSHLLPSSCYTLCHSKCRKSALLKWLKRLNQSHYLLLDIRRYVIEKFGLPTLLLQNGGVETDIQ